jgi:hypothetical protein
MYRWAGLVLTLLIIQGCAPLEEPRWAMLGDTSEQAFFIDRENVERLPDGSYSYPVKVCLYVEGRVHKKDESNNTNQVLFVEMNCKKLQWKETGRGVMDKNGKILFRRTSLMPDANTIEADTIHQSAFNYLCNDDSVVAQHNH